MSVRSVIPWGVTALMSCSKSAAGQLWWLRPDLQRASWQLLPFNPFEITETDSATPHTHAHTLMTLPMLFSHHNYPTMIYSLGQRKTEPHYYLKQIVLSARSATALAFSISVAWRWKAMYCSQRMELLGLLSTRRSKSSADWGCRLGSIKAASNLQSSFSFFCFSSSFSFFVCFFSCKSKKGGLGKSRHFIGRPSYRTARPQYVQG